MTFKATRQTVQAVAQTASESIFRVSRVMVDDATSSGVGILAKRETNDIPFAWTYSEENGGSTVSVSSLFPSGEYAELNYTPTWSGHRFIGWFPSAAAPSQAVPDMTGAITASTPVTFSATAVYARWQLPHTVTFDAGDGTISGPSSITVYEGQPLDLVNALPSATKTGEDFLGWRDANGGVVTSSTIYSSTMGEAFTAAYGTFVTKYTVTTTSSYKNTGIYAAARYDSSAPILVSWGDGDVTAVDGNISQLAHTYATAGTFTVGITDNISSLQFSAIDSTWYNTTSQNRYTLKSVTALASRITGIPSYCFYYCSALTSFVWPANTTTVYPYAFYHCSLLTSVSIPSTVTSIRSNAFAHTNIYGFTLPAGLTSIGDWAFSEIHTSNFSSITIPSSVTSIAVCAFYGDYYLINITFESGTSTLTLGSNAFQLCGLHENAMEIDLSPRKITSIPDHCFASCSCLKSVVWPQNVTSIGTSAFSGCWSLSGASGTCTVPEGVTSIGQYAFAYTEYLTALTLPSTLSTLSNCALYKASHLETLTVNRSSAPTASSITFGNSSDYYTGRSSYSAGTNKLIVPAGATGYDTGPWLDPLCNADKCGFTLVEQEPSS